MKVYVIWADTYNAPYGCQVSLFGVYSTKELAESSVKELEKQNIKGASEMPLYYCIVELNMNECNEIYLDGYFE